MQNSILIQFNTKSFFELYEDEVLKARNALAELAELFPKRATFGYTVLPYDNYNDEVWACSVSPDDFL